MGVTQYIGARYVPIMADPIEWSSTKSYEPLTIVTYQGDSYTSRQFVPVGIDIGNAAYWACTGNYNAQVEQYRQEVRAFDTRITTAQDTADEAKSGAQAANASLGSGWGSDNTVRAFANDVASNLSDLDTQLDDVSGDVSQLAGTVSDLSGTVGNIRSDLTAAQTSIANTNTTLTGFSPTNRVKTYVDNAIASAVQAQKPMVVIGDSFSNTYYITEENLWYHPVADFLNCDVHAYTERGAGYRRAGNSGHTFSQLATLAVNDTSFANAEVKWVFVYGGLNDLDHENAQTAFTTDFTSFCNYVHASFPNAQLVVCGINAWQSGFSFYNTGTEFRGQVYYESQMPQQTGFINAHGIFVSMCGALGFNSTWYDNTNSHPNNAGQNAIASWILSAMFGTGLVRNSSTSWRASGDTTGKGTATFHFRPGCVEFTGQVNQDHADAYIIDGLGFFKDAAIDTRGIPILGAGAGIFGWFRGKDSSGYVGTNSYGFFHGSREF